MNKLLCLALLPLLLGASAAMAHDDEECRLYHEAVCDETATDPKDWNACAVIVADVCDGHVDPAHGTQGKFTAGVDRRLETKIARDLKRLKLQRVQTPKTVIRSHSLKSNALTSGN